MNRTTTPRRAHHGISIQQIGAETLLYDERSHRAFCLNETSSILWRLADGTRTVDQLSAQATAELGAPVGRELVLYALQQLHSDGLMVLGASLEAASAISRRELLQRLGTGGAILLPLIVAIAMPTPAQAYNGCVDCPATSSVSRQRRAQQNTAKPPVAPAGTPEQ
jgi:hypothetical protein